MCPPWTAIAWRCTSRWCPAWNSSRCRSECLRGGEEMNYSSKLIKAASDNNWQPTKQKLVTLCQIEINLLSRNFRILKQRHQTAGGKTLNEGRGDNRRPQLLTCKVRGHRTLSGESVRNGLQNVQEDVRLQRGYEGYMVLRQILQQHVIRLT